MQEKPKFCSMSPFSDFFNVSDLYVSTKLGLEGDTKRVFLSSSPEIYKYITFV